MPCFRWCSMNVVLDNNMITHQFGFLDKVIRESHAVPEKPGSNSGLTRGRRLVYFDLKAIPCARRAHSKWTNKYIYIYIYKIYTYHLLFSFHMTKNYVIDTQSKKNCMAKHIRYWGFSDNMKIVMSLFIALDGSDISITLQFAANRSTCNSIFNCHHQCINVKMLNRSLRNLFNLSIIINPWSVS